MATNYYKLPTVDPDSTLSFPDAVNGLANATDAVLHGIQSGFERKEYTLPTATSERLGGVRIGKGFDVYSDGLLTTQVGAYELPPAGANKLGGVLIGKNVTVDAAGRIGIGAGAMSGLEANENTLKANAITTEKLADYAVGDSQIAASILSTLNAGPTLWKNAQRSPIYAAGTASSQDTYLGDLISITDRIKVFWPYVFSYHTFSNGQLLYGNLYSSNSKTVKYEAGQLGSGRICGRIYTLTTATSGTYAKSSSYVDIIVNLDGASAITIAHGSLSTTSLLQSATPGYLLV